MKSKHLRRYVHVQARELQAFGPGPNRTPFKGVLTYVDRPSDESLYGSRGHRVILPRAAAEESLHTLLGMGINVHPTGHRVTDKCGVITAATLQGDALCVEGIAYTRDCPALLACLEEPELWGMSYELLDVEVPDMRAKVWTMQRITFTGAAVLLRKHAAFKQTQFQLEKPVASGPLSLQGVVWPA